MKNRYCRRTKLSEETFFVILHCFCTGMTATDTHKACNGWKIKVSRQTIERKFLELGHYIYQKNVRAQLLANYRKQSRRKGSDRAVEKMLLNDLWMSMREEVNDERHPNEGIGYPGSTVLVETLRQRWRAFSGFLRKTFPSHLGFSAFVNHEVERLGIEGAIERLRRQLEYDPL